MDIILQSEAAECGLSSVAMVASHHGYHTDLNQLRHHFPQSLKGTTLKQLTEIAASLGLTSRALKLDMEDIAHLSTPCVVHWQMNHFVVLKKVQKHKVIIIDPARGEITLTYAEFSSSFTGIALELSPNKQFVAKPKVKSGFTLSAIMSSAQGIKTPLIQLLLLSLLLQLFTLMFPYYMQLVVDQVLPSFDGQFLLVLALGFAGLTLFNGLVSALRGATIIYFSHSISQQMAFGLFNRVIHLPITFFEKRFVGDLVSRFGSLENLRQIITNHLVEGAVDGLMAITTLIMIYIYSPFLACVVTITMVLYLIIRLVTFRPLKRSMEQAIHHRAIESSNFMENVRAIQTIKLFSLENQRQNIWQNHYIKSLNCEIQVARLQLGYQLANALLFGLENVIVIYLGASLVLNPAPETLFTLGMLTAFIAYKSQLTQRFSGLVDKLIELKTLSIHLDRLSDFLADDPQFPQLQMEPSTATGQLTINNLSFAYQNDEARLFNNLNLDVKAGSSIAIIGASGCGKTTLFKLILGFLTPEAGSIQWHHHKAPNQSLNRRHIGTVMQNDQLLSGSIAANIAQFSERYEMEQVIKCAKLAAVHDDIVKMPMGYHTLIGEMGAALSGGQIQRIILARALFNSPKILLLDEASAHLDVRSEYLINQALASLKMTKLVIAHRPETITQCDVIYELVNGQLTNVTQAFLSSNPKRVNFDPTIPFK